MKDEGALKRPRAFLTQDDFLVVQDVLGAFIQYLKELKRESGDYQALYTKVEVAVTAMIGGQMETLNLDHGELMLLLRAILEFEDHVRAAKVGDLEPYRRLLAERIARVRARLLAALPAANLGNRARLN
jgi:hypothetical protein